MNDLLVQGKLKWLYKRKNEELMTSQDTISI